MRRFLNFFSNRKGKAEPLGTFQEQTARRIGKELKQLSFEAKDEILKLVVAAELPDKHIKYRPGHAPKEHQAVAVEESVA